MKCRFMSIMIGETFFWKTKEFKKISDFYALPKGIKNLRQAYMFNKWDIVEKEEDDDDTDVGIKQSNVYAFYTFNISGGGGLSSPSSPDPDDDDDDVLIPIP